MVLNATHRYPSVIWTTAASLLGSKGQAVANLGLEMVNRSAESPTGTTDGPAEMVHGVEEARGTIYSDYDELLNISSEEWRNYSCDSFEVSYVV